MLAVWLVNLVLVFFPLILINVSKNHLVFIFSYKIKRIYEIFLTEISEMMKRDPSGTIRRDMTLNTFQLYTKYLRNINDSQQQTEKQKKAIIDLIAVKTGMTKLRHEYRNKEETLLDSVSDVEFYTMSSRIECIIVRHRKNIITHLIQKSNKDVFNKIEC